MNKHLILGVAIAVLVAGLGVMISSESIRFGEALGSMRGSNPRIMALIILPFIVVLFVVGAYLRKKNEERKWKNALRKTRSGKYKCPGAADEFIHIVETDVTTSEPCDQPVSKPPGFDGSQ